MKKAKQIAGQWKEGINVMYTRLNVMYTRLNNTITNAIKNVMNNSVCDFDNWWKDDFETEVCFETTEDFKDLCDTDLEIAKYDWISWCIDGFVSEVCNLLGIEMYNTHSNYNEIILEEIHNIVKEILFIFKLDIENPIIRINTAFKGCSSLEKISVLPRIYHN